MIDINKKLFKNEQILLEYNNVTERKFLNHPFFHGNLSKSVFKYYPVKCYITNLRIILIGMQTVSYFKKMWVEYRELFIEYKTVGEMEVRYDYESKKYRLYLVGIDSNRTFNFWGKRLDEKTNFTWYLELEKSAFDLLVSKFKNENPSIIIRNYLDAQDVNIFKKFNTNDLLVGKDEKLLWNLEVNDKKDFLQKIAVSLFFTIFLADIYGSILPVIENGFLNS